MAVTLLGMGEINSEIRQALTVHRDPSLVSQPRKISLLEQLMLDSKCAKLVEALSSDPAIKEAASGDVITNQPGTGAITRQC